MDAFAILTKQARDKRNAIIKAARAEFWEAKKRINALRRQLNAEAAKTPSVKLPRVIDVIARVIPSDRAFTVNELVEILTVAEPGRIFQRETVREYLQRLGDRGVVRRVGRASNRVHWAAADYAGPVDPQCGKRLPELAGEILAESGPLRSLELLARIREHGYRAADDQRLVLRSLRMALWRCDAFQRDKTGKWTAVTQ